MRLLIALLSPLLITAMTDLALAQTPSQGILPPGHPEIPGVAPSSQPASYGTLTIRCIQGTKGAAVPTSQPVMIELAHQDKVIRQFEAKLDDKGAAVVPNISLSLAFQPWVSTIYQGVVYRAPGDLMDSQHPSQTIDLTVFESTEQAPQWQVQKRLVMVSPLPEGLRVTDVLIVNNPTDRIWLGTPDGKGGHAALAIPAPPGALDPAIGGQPATIQDGKIISSDPLSPGESQIQLSYSIPAEDNQAKLRVLAPAPTTMMAVYLPPEGTSVTVTGLENAGLYQTQTTRSLMYKGVNLPAGHETVLTAILPAKPQPPTAASSAGKIVAGIGAVLVLAIGIAVIMLKSPKKVPTKK